MLFTDFAHRVINITYLHSREYYTVSTPEYFQHMVLFSLLVAPYSFVVVSGSHHYI